MNFFKTVYASFYNPSFYAEAKNKTKGQLVKYYAKLALFVAVIAGIVSFVTLYPTASKGVAFVKEQALTLYPTDLVLTIHKGELSTNASSTEPLVIALTPVLKKEMIDENMKKGNGLQIDNLVIIDTQRETIPTIEEFKKMNSFFFLGNNYSLSIGENGSISFEDFSKIPDTKIDRGAIEKILGYAGYLPKLIPFVFFVGVFFMVFGVLVLLLLTALILFLLLKVMKKEVAYKEAYKLCVYASTLPLFIDWIFFLLNIHIPFLFTLLTLIVVWLNIKDAPEQEVLPEATV